MGSFSSVEIQMLWLSVVLGLVQLLLATVLGLGERGLPWGLSSRDAAAPTLSPIAGRAERAFKNFLETFVFFLGAVLVASAMGKLNGWTALGAQIYFWSRLVYAPVYILAIPLVRTLAWFASLAGIVLILIYGVWPSM